MSQIWKNNIIIAAGNNAVSAGHFRAVMISEKTLDADISVSEYERSLNVQIWKYYGDEAILKLSVLQEKAADKSKRFSARSVFVWKIQRFYCITVSLHPIRSIRKFISTLFHRDSIWRAVSGRSGFFQGGLSEGIFRCGFQRRGF